MAVAGIGCCTSHLVQGIYKYWDVLDNERWVPGLMHPVLGEYRIRDIKFVAAFDIDRRKIGTDLSEAIFSAPNNMTKFSDVPKLGVTVKMGPVLDGAPPHLRGGKFYDVADDLKPCDVVAELKASGAEILVNFIPTGSQNAARFYADCALAAGLRIHQLHAGVHLERCGVRAEVQGREACPWSATTSSRRSARRSCTASWPSSSWTAG